MQQIKKIAAVIICICIVITNINTLVSAEEQTTENESNSIAEIGGYLASNGKAINTLMGDKKFSTKQGHGFAAENGNNLSDIYHGKNASVVGGDNVKNGPDRKIIDRNGEVIWVQDKYYSTASKSIDACFDETGFRYWDSKGNPMKIEVPSDQYEKAVEKMAQKIRDGKVKIEREGKILEVTDPAEAANLVKKGNLTYKQAVNITKAGNIDSLIYDSKNGAITAVGAIGIGTALDFAINMLNGEEFEDSLETAVKNGFETGGVVFATYVISSQLTKTGLEKAFIPTSEAIVNRFGPKFAESLLTSSGTKGVTAMTSAQLTKNAASLIRSQALFAAVTVVVLETGDVVDIFRGRISKEQFLSNLAVTASGVASGVGGFYAGGAVGTFICPGIGTTIGGIVGGVASSVGGTYLAQKAADAIYEGDGAKMYEIIETEFQNLAFDYIVNEDEAKAIAKALSEKLIEDELKNMYSSEDRVKYANKLIEPLFEKEVAKRAKIEMPTEEEIRAELLVELDGLVFIH